MDFISWTNDHNANLDTLEAMIDRFGLAYILSTLAEVCSAKADHVTTNWQDRDLENAWNRNAARLLNAEVKLIPTS